MSEAYLGEIRMFAGNYEPQDWALCDGSLVSVNAYQALFSVLGTVYGGNGVTNFGLPDYRGRLPIGQGNGPGLTPRVLGQATGAEAVSLTSANTPAHTHAFVVSSTLATSATPVPPAPAAPSSQTFGQFAGAGVIKGLYSAGTNTAPSVNLNPNFLDPAAGVAVSTPHSNMMGSLAINYIICLAGIYPTRP